MTAVILALSLAAGVQWRAPAACPDADALAQRIGALVGEGTIDAPVTVDVEARGGGYAAELALEVDGRSLHRSLRADDCEALADATAVVIAVSVDPVRVRDTAARAVAVLVPEAVAARPSTVQPRAAPVARVDAGDRVAPAPAASSLVTEPRAAIGYGTGFARGGSGLVDLAVDLGRDAWRVELGARWAWPRRFVDDGRGAEVTAATLTPAVCLRPTIGRVALALCPGLEAGLAWARGLGWDPSRRRRFPWLAPRLQTRVHVGLGRRVALFVAAEAAVPIVRPGIGVVRDGEVQTVWQSPPASLRVLAGVGVRLGGR